MVLDTVQVPFHITITCWIYIVNYKVIIDCISIEYIYTLYIDDLCYVPATGKHNMEHFNHVILYKYYILCKVLHYPTWNQVMQNMAH